MRSRPTVPPAVEHELWWVGVGVIFTPSRRLLSQPDQEAASVELIYELVYTFCHTYIADFTPLRKFIDEEIVPVRHT